MKQSNLHDWIQSVAPIGVVAGLLLVAYELNQNTQQLYGEGIRGVHIGYRTQAVSELETDIHSLMVKSFEDPEGLTAEEILKLNTYYILIYDTYLEWENMYEIGSIRYSGVENFRGEIDVLFSSRFGRAWYASNRSWLPPKFVEILDQELDGRPIQDAPPTVEAIRAQLKRLE